MSPVTHDELQQLRRTARQFLENEAPVSHLRQLIHTKERFSPDVWKHMAELGWMGVDIPEEFGGIGLGFDVLATICEEMGRVLLLSPFVATTILGSAPIVLSGRQDLASRLLPGTVDGSRVLTGAYLEDDSWYDWKAISTTVEERDAVSTLRGRKVFVPYAQVADALIVSAHQQGRPVLAVVDLPDESVAVGFSDTMDWQPLCEVTFDNTSVPAQNVIRDAEPIIKAVRSRLIVAACMEQVGGADRALDMANEYAKERVAFGRPIGSFQAIKHRLANMLVEVTAARALSYAAARSITGGDDDPHVVSMAKSRSNEAFRRVASEALQIHGGIGFTWEHDIHLYLRHAQAMSALWGDSLYHQDVVSAGFEGGRGRKGQH